MGLNNVHLKFKINGAAASQRNSMAHTRDRGKQEDEVYFFYDLTPTGEWKHGWLYGKIQRDRQTLRQVGDQEKVHLRSQHTCCTTIHTHLCPSGTAGRSI